MAASWSPGRNQSVTTNRCCGKCPPRLLEPSHFPYRGFIMSNSKKVVVITGASQGLGAAAVKAYRELGYRVVATSRSIKPSTDLDILTVAGDIADPATAERVIRECVARFGRIDTLVNNAGIFLAKPFTQFTGEDYAINVATNMGSFFNMSQQAIAQMEKQ